jgi:Secretion system C-terminal sorting domain
LKYLFILFFGTAFLQNTTAQNLVTNGDFSLGNTGFTTGYILDCTIGGAIGEARYCVGTNPNAVHNAWSACGDHTTGSGNMMILNGTSAPNVIVWQKTPVAVTPNTCYQFCVWATSVYFGNPGKIKLIVNGATQAFTQLSSTTCAWQQICGVWNSGPANSATLTIIDEDLNPGGNDLAIDDISFTAIATPCSITLPLQWSYIKSTAKNNTNLIEWAVEQDINNANFIVEKSTDGRVFNAIGNVAKNITNIYNYVDANTTPGTGYYRIKQIDLDGHFSYSAITKVYNSGKESNITLLQNPVEEFASIKINAKKGAYTLQIYNAVGSKIITEKIIMQAESLEKKIPTQHLNIGMYIIQLINSNGQNVASEKFIKR